ncbi:MAG: hypothetical protein ACE5LU_25410 [Anaerolineae bacterium]
MRLVRLLGHSFLFSCAGLLAYFLVTVAQYGRVTLVEPRYWLVLVEIGMMLGIMGLAAYLFVRENP